MGGAGAAAAGRALGRRAARAAAGAAAGGGGAAAPPPLPGPAVGPEWVARERARRGLAVLDCSWYAPGLGRDGPAEWQARRVPGAGFLCPDAVSDSGAALPHMFPSQAGLSAAAAAAGVAPGSPVVVYDGHSCAFAAARAWYMFRSYGWDVAVMDGGLPAWERAGLPVETSLKGAEEAAAAGAACRSAHSAAAEAGKAFQGPGGAVVSLDELRARLASGACAVVDARSAARFAGTAPEPRPGLPSGHMPGSVNVPFDVLLNDRGELKPADDLEAVFQRVGVRDPDQEVVLSCGTGVTACVPALALVQLGFSNIKVYDGSWTEWASRDDTEVLTAA